MADLSAVLRKTIDALPSASPQLRAKVYEKARAAIERQIASANPPLTPETVEARQAALEDAIAATESHYQSAAGSNAPAGPAVAPPTEQLPAEAPVEPAHREEPVPHAGGPREPSAAQGDVSPATDEAPERSFERAAAAAPPVSQPRAYEPTFGNSDVPPPVASESRPALRPASQPSRREPAFDAPRAADPEARVGEIGPVSEPVDVRSAAGSEIPRAETALPGYARPRTRGRGSSVATGLAALLFIGALGAVAYLYGEEISEALGVGGQVASVETTETPEATAVPEAAEPPADTAAAPAEPDPVSRQFTQRLLPDGTEIDAGPAEATPNAFDEGTDVAAASVVEGEPAPAASAETPAAPAETAAASGEAVPVGQRAVFYEERSTDRPGSQRGGNVVWSVVNEPPAAGQPAEPAIRAVADVAETDLRMTMTIRRNADETLPASHVIEILFDTPDDFAGGEIENVQRLALKPTEQARGEPLIGVAGKISDGFFIIALNDLEQAVDSNLALMAREEWIDIPLAYASGQRALMTLEKGIPGERVFQEAMDAWAARAGAASPT